MKFYTKEKSNSIFIIKILILLISSGICSVLERTLLATFQQRQSPANASLFGISNLVLDGLKLFGKVAGEINFRTSSITILFLVGFLEVIAWDNFFIRNPSCNFFLMTGFLFSLSLIFFFELLEFIEFSPSSNRFLTLALNRIFQLAMAMEISFMGILLIGIFSDLFYTGIFSQKNPWGAWAEIIFILAFAFPTWILFMEKVPFDLIEAESELIDGATIELSGINFSSAYAAEISLSLISLKVFVIYFSIASITILFFLIFISFMGRLSLSRFLISDAINFILGTSLWVIPGLLLWI